MKDLETLALELLRSQSQFNRPPSELVYGTQEMCAVRDREARQPVVAELIGLCIQVSAFVEALYEASREDRESTVDLLLVFFKGILDGKIENVKVTRVTIETSNTIHINGFYLVGLQASTLLSQD